jgi:4-diphosphocytidyl-2-C-methyl-D-erythritol kinase
VSADAGHGAHVQTAYAKINLALHVRRRRFDGYHDLESLFAFAEDGDELSALAADDLTLHIDGPFAADLGNGADNLVMRAAQAMRTTFGVASGAALRLTKNLPVASGIGGGSADAAAALRVLCQLWKVDSNDSQIHDIAVQLGADVPACLVSQTLRGEARGEQLALVDGSDLNGVPLLLVNPRVPLSTAAVFAKWDGIDHGALEHGDPLAVALAGRNDLTDAAIEVVPAIADVLSLLGGLPGVQLARMSGSGATCFALFDAIASRDAGALAMQAAMPEAWFMMSTLR